MSEAVGPVVGRDWFVNGEGQTFAVVRGPVEFTMGSPPTEPGRVEGNEPAHRKRVERTFAVATREVAVAEFLRFRPGHSWVNRYSPDADSPAVEVAWYDAAAYCNWLSRAVRRPGQHPGVGRGPGARVRPLGRNGSGEYKILNN